MFISVIHCTCIRFPSVRRLSITSANIAKASRASQSSHRFDLGMRINLTRRTRALCAVWLGGRRWLARRGILWVL